jgi:hypothetical protein
MSRRLLLSCSFVLSASLLLPSPSALSGTYVSSAIWKKSTLKVCVLSQPKNIIHQRKKTEEITTDDLTALRSAKPSSRELQQKIINLIQSEFTQEKTGIDFTQFKDCKEAPNSDLALTLLDLDDTKYESLSFDGIAFIGKNSDGLRSRNRTRFLTSKKIPLVVIVNFKNSVDRTMRTAAHEFGHAAGLIHEHPKSSEEYDPNCKQLEKAQYVRTTQTPYRDSDGLMIGQMDQESFGPYDFDSIMNECYIGFADNFLESNIQIESLAKRPNPRFKRSNPFSSIMENITWAGRNDGFKAIYYTLSKAGSPAYDRVKKFLPTLSPGDVATLKHIYPNKP